MITPTTSYGLELEPGDEFDLADTPVCCGEDMAAETAERGYRRHTCETCSTVVTISPNGLVFDIKEG